MLRAQTSSAEASFPFCKEEVDALRYDLLFPPKIFIGLEIGSLTQP